MKTIFNYCATCHSVLDKSGECFDCRQNSILMKKLSGIRVVIMSDKICEKLDLIALKMDQILRAINGQKEPVSKVIKLPCSGIDVDLKDVDVFVKRVNDFDKCNITPYLAIGFFGGFEKIISEYGSDNHYEVRAFERRPMRAHDARDSDFDFLTDAMNDYQNQDQVKPVMQHKSMVIGD